MTDNETLPEPAMIPADAGTAQLLKDMPKLIGAIDSAIKDTAKKPLAFILLVFDEGMALHGTNADPVAAHLATRAYLDSMEARKAADDAAAQASNDAAGNVAD